MASTLAWLDFSADEQRRAREIVALFTQRESRDELGLGVIRDTFSEAMFPGTSVVQTRARYLLFVPWLFQVGASRRREGEALTSWVEGKERRLVEVLRRGGDLRGLIGRQAGARVKILPSTIYWSALQRYEILRGTWTVEQAVVGRRITRSEAAATETVERSTGIWDPEIPPWPAGFPDIDRLDFVLTEDERSWLRERIVASCEGSALAWMTARRLTPTETDGPWSEPWRSDLPAAIERVVHHAQLFSLAMHGAAILYNILLAERCGDLDIPRDPDEREAYRAALSEWEDEIAFRRTELVRWNVEDLWSLMGTEALVRVGMARLFVDRWLQIVRSGPLDGDRIEEARRLVADRERTQKGSQSRLVNERLLRQWGGYSGIGRLDFRWGQVRTMLQDVNGVAVDAGS